MKEKYRIWGWLLGGVVFLGIVMALGIKYNESIESEEPDVIRSNIFRVDDSYSESLIVVANTNKIDDKIAFVEKILKMYIDNSSVTLIGRAYETFSVK